MESKLIDRIVHFPDGEGNLHQGRIVATWLEFSTEQQGLETTQDGEIRLLVECTDQRYRYAYPHNCIAGPIPETDEQRAQRGREKAERERRRR